MRNKILKGAIILTIANIITRFLGFIYRIYMSNLIGAEGMGLYQLVMPIYMLVWSFSSSGFATTISKLVSEENSKKEYGNTKRILKISCFLSTFIATFFSVFILIFSKFIAIKIFKDERILLSLHIMCFSFPFMAFGSCIRGYFLGMQNSTIPAISQVLEQIIRMVFIYSLSYIFIPMGITYACGLAIFGMTMGEIFSFLYVYLIYKSKRNLFQKTPKISKRKCCFTILAMAIPLTSNRVLGSFLATIENILIPQKLVEYGYTNFDAISIFGKLTGMAMPLLMFPASLLTAVSISCVPVISEAMAMKNYNSIKNAISKCFLFTFIIGIGTMGVFITFPYELGYVVYSQKDIGEQLLILGILCPLLYCNITISGILNGLGEQMLIFKSSLLSSIISISFIYFFIPKFGLNAFFIGWFLSVLIVNIISIRRLKKRVKFKIDFKNNISKPILCIISSSIISKYFYKFISNYFSGLLNLLISLIILGFIYLFLLLILDCINLKEFFIKKK